MTIERKLWSHTPPRKAESAQALKRKMDQVGHRILGGIAGGFVGAIVYAIAHLFIAGVNISAEGILLLFLPGLVVGAALGAMFPQPFTWLAELILDSWL